MNECHAGAAPLPEVLAQQRSPSSQHERAVRREIAPRDAPLGADQDPRGSDREQHVARAPEPQVRGTAVQSAGLGDALRSEEHTSELQSRRDLVCRLLLEKKNFSPARTPMSATTALCTSPISNTTLLVVCTPQAFSTDNTPSGPSIVITKPSLNPTLHWRW